MPLLELLGQTNKQAAKRDLNDYDPKTGTLDRGFLERLGDSVFRGGSEKVNEAARDLYVEQLEGTNAGKILKLEDPDAEFSSSDTDVDIARRGRDAKIKNELITKIGDSGQSELTATELKDKTIQQLRGLVKKTSQQSRTSDFLTDPINIQNLRLRAEDKADRERASALDRKERFELREQNRLEAAKDREANLSLQMSDLDLRRQQQANEMAMFEQRLERERAGDRKERIAAIMASLANLGGAFAI